MIKISLDKKIYTFQSDLNIWARPDYTSIAYSDGDNQESLLLEIVKNTKDLSINSLELKKKCINWVTSYHFSDLRANLLRPLYKLFHKETKVLEIGAGCGALTRFLGETGAQILALEGSVRRATITRTRTHDLENVIVISERFDNFKSSEKYDVITLIGVLEYANIFSTGPDSAKNMLTKIKSMLKQGGKLIVAIENQLGLKYFAGAGEDHIGRLMYGIEDRYTSNEAQTFGYHVLKEKLITAGLTFIETLLPFPDYKFPVSIITETGISTDEFNASVFASQSVCADMQLPSKVNLIQELAWPVIFKNKLAIELSNSFLIISSSCIEKSFDENLLAIHYSANRHPSFKKQTTFKYIDSKGIKIKRELLSPTYPIKQSKILSFNLNKYSTYISGRPLETKVVEIVTTPNWSMEHVTDCFLQYLDLIKITLHKDGYSYSNLTDDTILPSEYLDAILTNFIIDKNNQPHYFDREWFAVNGVSVGQLIFRSAIDLIGNISCFAKPKNHGPYTRGEFIRQLFKKLAFNYNDSQFDTYFQLELDLKLYALGDLINDNLSWNPEQPLRGLETICELEKATIQIKSLHVELETLQLELLNIKSGISGIIIKILKRLRIPK